MSIALRIMCGALVLALVYPYGYFILKKSHGPVDNAVSVRGSVEAFVITLADHQARYEHTLKSTEPLGVKTHKVLSVDGSTLSADEIAKAFDKNSYASFQGSLPKLGKLGCYLGHLKAWKAFLESTAEFGLILEDDVSFDPILMTQVIERLQDVSRLWDVVSFDVFHSGMPMKIAQLTPRHQLSLYLTYIDGGGGYLINRKAASALIGMALPIRVELDKYFTRGWELGLRFTGVNPVLVYQTHGTSKSNSSKAMESPRSPKLSRHLFRLQSHIARFCYNLGLYIKIKLFDPPNKPASRTD